MHKSLLGFFVVTLLFAGGYWYYHTDSLCSAPIPYDIGAIDSRFGITKGEVEDAVFDAETLWEDGVGKELFVYKPGAPLTISLVYDDRQKTTAVEEEERNKLDDKEAINNEIHAAYERAVAEYESAKKQYEEKVDVYNARLATYNADVDAINARGGASRPEAEALEERQRQLTRESDTLSRASKEVSELGEQANQLGEKGNKAVAEYNEEVAWYNNLFGHEREFTQGEYRDGAITIYQYRDRDELRRVLAHEFGHALALDHVEDPHGIMYYLLEGGNAEFKLTKADTDEYIRICEAENPLFADMRSFFLW